MIYSIYFFFGSDPKEVKLGIQNLEVNISQNQLISDNITFFLSETSWKQVLREIYTESFFEGIKLVKIYDIHLLDQKLFLEFLDQSFSNVIAIFIAYGDKIEDHFSSKLLKAIQNKGLICSTKKKYSNQLMNKLNLELKAFKYIYSEKVFHYLCQQLDGLDTSIPKIIKQLRSFYPKGSILKFDDISYFIRSENIPSSFEFIDYFFSKDWIEALNYLILYQENYFHILFLIYRQIELIYYIKENYIKGISKEKIFKDLKIHPFIGEKVMKQSTKWSFKELEKIYTQLSLIHKALKISDPQWHADLIQIYLFSSISTE